MLLPAMRWGCRPAEGVGGQMSRRLERAASCASQWWSAHVERQWSGIDELVGDIRHRLRVVLQAPRTFPY